MLGSLRIPQRILWLALVVVVVATALVGVRSAQRAAYWRAHTDEPIRSWMTIGYIAHSYHVPPHVLNLALGLPAAPPEKRPLGVLARAQHRQVSDLISRLDTAILHARPPYPPPPPPPQ